jgi:hypothetical protein
VGRVHSCPRNMSALLHSNLPDLTLISKGKVRDIYSISPDCLLFVASDRISAYDVVLKNVCIGVTKSFMLCFHHDCRASLTRENFSPNFRFSGSTNLLISFLTMSLPQTSMKCQRKSKNTRLKWTAVLCW